MPDRFRDKYRIPSARLQCWDYGSNVAYFITICTAHRERYFGEIIAGLDNEQPTMLLSEIGEIAQQCWQEIPNHFPFVILDEYVVMPNHVHGIIIVNKPDDSCRNVIHCASTDGRWNTWRYAGGENPILYANISRIIRWYFSTGLLLGSLVLI